MNSVHEPGPNSDSKTVSSRKFGSKLSQVHKEPNLAQLSAQARPGARTRGRVVASPAPCRGRDPGRVVGAGRRIVGAASAVSWTQAPCRSALCCASVCRVLGCLTIQPCLKPSPGHNTLRCIAIQKLSSLPSLCHNTAGVLQYNIPTAHLSCNTLPCLSPSQLAIHLGVLQYSP